MSFSLNLDNINVYKSAEEAMIVRGLHMNTVIDKINEIDAYNTYTGPRFERVTIRSYPPSKVTDADITRGFHLRAIINEINRIIVTDNLPITLLDTAIIYRNDYRIQDDVVIVRDTTLKQVIVKVNGLSSIPWHVYWTTRIYEETDLLLHLDSREGGVMNAVIGDDVQIATPCFYANSSAYYYFIAPINIGRTHTIEFEVDTNILYVCTNGSTTAISVGENSVNYRCSASNHPITVNMPLGFHKIRIERVEKEINVYVDDQAPVPYTLSDLHNVEFLIMNIGRYATLTGTGIYPRFSCTGHEWLLTGEYNVNDRIGTSTLYMLNETDANRVFSIYGTKEGLDKGFSRYVREGFRDIDIPYLSDGTPMINPVIPVAYTLQAHYDGIVDKHNLLYSKIIFTDDFFDRSNTTIWNDSARLGHYDVANPKHFHISELTFITLIEWLNVGYAGRLFPINSVVEDERVSFDGLLLYTTDKTLDAERNVLTYTKDISKAIFSDPNTVVYDDLTGYVLFS